MKVASFLLFALLPLQWVAVTVPLGQLRLHQVALFCFAAWVFAHFSLRSYSPILRFAAALVVANMYLISSIAIMAVYRGGAPNPALRPLLYLLVFIAMAAFVHRAAGGRDVSSLTMLRLAAPILGASLLIGFAMAMLVNGVNPAAIFAKSVAAADPEIFQKQVFKTGFAGFGLDDDTVQGNLRHEVFGSVLLSMLVSTWAMRVGPTPSARLRTFYQVAMVLGLTLLAVSLSRSVLIAAVVWPALAMLRSVRRGELSSRQIAAFFGAVVSVVVLLISGLAAVLTNRFVSDTGSYESRSALYAEAFSALPQHWIVGGFDTVNASSHNFVIDTLLRDGVFAAVPAAFVVLWMLGTFAAATMRLHILDAAMVPVVAALALPLVRVFTSGGGLIPPVEWLALAFFVGVAAARQQSPPHPTPVDRHLGSERTTAALYV